MVLLGGNSVHSHLIWGFLAGPKWVCHQSTSWSVDPVLQWTCQYDQHTYTDRQTTLP